MQLGKDKFKEGMLTLVMAGVLSTGLMLAPTPALAEDGDAVEPASNEEVVAQPVTESEPDPVVSEVPAPTYEEPAPVYTEPAPVSEEPVVTPEVVQDDAVVDGDAEAAGEAVAEPTEEAAGDAIQAEATTEETTSANAKEAELVEEAIPTSPGTTIEKATGNTIESGKPFALQTDVTSGKVVDAAGKNPGDGSKIDIWTYNKGNNQKWIAEEYENSKWYILRSAVNNSLVMGVQNGTQVKLVDVNKADLLSVLWAFVTGSNGSCSLKNASDTSKYLTVTGGKADNGTALQLANNTTNASKFYARPVTAKVEGGLTDKEAAYNLTISSTSNMVVDIMGGGSANGTNAGIWQSNNGGNQKIYLEPDGKGFYTAWIVGTRKVLDVAGASILKGANVLQWTNSGNDNQKWAVKVLTDGSYGLQNKATGLWLRAASAEKKANVFGDVVPTGFKLTLTNILSAGIVEIKPRTSSAVSLDVAAASSKDGAALDLWSDSNMLHQRFELVAAGTGYWRVRTAASGGYLTADTSTKKVTQQGKGSTEANETNTWLATFRGGWYGLMLKGTNFALDMTGGKTTNGTKIGVWQANGRDSQHFTFTSADLINGGLYYIVSRRDNRVLDVAGGSKKAGGNIDTWTKSGNNNQKFMIEKVGSAANSVFKISNLNSGLFLTAAGTKDADGYANVTQQAWNSSNAHQRWKAVIGDDGYIEFVDNNGNGLNLFARDDDSKYNVAARTMTTKSSQTNGRGFKLSAASGWMKYNGEWHFYNNQGNRVTRDGYAYQVSQKLNGSWKNTKSGYFGKKYFVSTDVVKSRTIVWEKDSSGNWVPKYDWLAATAAPNRRTTGWFKFGAGKGLDGIYPQANGRSTYISQWRVHNAIFIIMDLCYHSLIDGISASAQLGRQVSHGCVRLEYKNMTWLWNNCVNGTGTYLYAGL